MLKKPTYTWNQRPDLCRFTDNDAIVLLFQEYYLVLYFLAYSIMNNIAESEDIVMMTFMKLLEKRGFLRLEGDCKSYLYSCVRNACIDRLRRRKIRMLREKEWGALNNVKSNDSFERLLTEEMYKHLDGALQALPPGCRKIISMVFMEGKSHQEVANALNLSINTVRNQKHRGLSLLRIRLFPFCSPIVWLLGFLWN